MLKRSILSIATTLLCVFGGCKTPPVAHVDTFVPFVLVDPGREPRMRLRYEVAEGTITRSTMRFGVETTGEKTATRFVLGLRNSVLEFKAGPAAPTENGVRFPFEIVAAKATTASREDAEWAESIAGASAMVEIDPRGNVIWAETNERAAKMSARTRVAIVTASFGLTRIVLPKEPVGMGASWQTRTWAAVLNFKSLQVMTYTWVGQIDGKLIIDVAYEESGEPQNVNFVGERAPIDVESLEIRGTGRVLLDATALMSSATATGLAKEELVVDQDGSVQNVTVEEAFDIEVSLAPSE